MRTTGKRVSGAIHIRRQMYGVYVLPEMFSVSPVVCVKNNNSDFPLCAKSH